jgi:hypothetical protein
MVAARSAQVVRIGVLMMLGLRAAAADFHIEAGEATLTLNLFSHQSGLQVLYDYNVMHGRLTQALSGDYELHEALAVFLRGTDLHYDLVNERTMAITLETAPPASSTELVRWLRGFEAVAQSYALEVGPRPPRLTLQIMLTGELVQAR